MLCRMFTYFARRLHAEFTALCFMVLLLKWLCLLNIFPMCIEASGSSYSYATHLSEIQASIFFIFRIQQCSLLLVLILAVLIACILTQHEQNLIHGFFNVANPILENFSVNVWEKISLAIMCRKCLVLRQKLNYRISNSWTSNPGRKLWTHTHL